MKPFQMMLFFIPIENPVAPIKMIRHDFCNLLRKCLQRKKNSFKDSQNRVYSHKTFILMGAIIETSGERPYPSSSRHFI